MRRKNTALGNEVRCALKTSVRVYHLHLDQLFCETSCIPSRCFFGIWGIFVCFYSVLVWSHRAENIVCTHHGTDIQINSTGCFSLHHSWELSSELSSSQVGCACYVSVHLDCIRFLFNGGKITLTVVRNQKYPFPSLFLTPRKF